MPSCSSSQRIDFFSWHLVCHKRSARFTSMWRWTCDVSIQLYQPETRPNDCVCQSLVEGGERWRRRCNEETTYLYFQPWKSTVSHRCTLLNVDVFSFCRSTHLPLRIVSFLPVLKVRYPLKSGISTVRFLCPLGWPAIRNGHVEMQRFAPWAIDGKKWNGISSMPWRSTNWMLLDAGSPLKSILSNHRWSVEVSIGYAR